ncbi:MAG: DUF5939 domain-containing protein [Polyangiaceae bacterium]
MAEPIVFEYRYETRASIRRAFRVLSDTDAFNVVAEANMSFRLEPREGGTARAIGSVSKLGMTVRWDEEPFSFRAPYWFQIRRVFHNGPAERMTARAELTPLQHGGTAIHYRLTVLARSALFRPILSFDLKRSVEPGLRAALAAVLATLEQNLDDDPGHSVAGPPPALRSHQAARLAELVGRLPSSPLVTRLAGFIRGAPVREQFTMSPIAFAQAWATPLEDVAQLFIDAATVGLLGVRVDLLCPACLVPKAAVDANGRLPELHCDACGIRLDQSFPEGLAVHFFTSPQIRDLRMKIECLGSPQRTPQVVAQDTIAPGAEVNLATELEQGTYQLRSLPIAGPPALLDVRDAATTNAANFTLAGSIQPQLARVRSTPEAIRVRNNTSTPHVVVLERVLPPRRVLTLGRMLIEYPGLGEIVPWRGLVSSVSSYSGLAVAVQSTSPADAEATAAALSSARLVYGSGWVTLATYSDAAVALRDLSKLDLSARLTAICAGLVSESQIGGKVVPVGPAVDDAHTAMQSGAPNYLVIRDADLGAPGFALALDSAGLHPTESARGMTYLTRS